MKIGRIIPVVFITVVLISTIMRETGLLEFDLYKFDNHLSASDDWTEINTPESENKDQKRVDRNDLSILILQGEDILYKQRIFYRPNEK